jgi:hypothetical protein
MAVDSSILQGQIIQDPDTYEKDVEGLLRGFLHALQKEAEGAQGMTQSIDERHEPELKRQAN